MNDDKRKAVMIGCGNVGSAIVFALIQEEIFTEIAMIDIDSSRAEGEAMDISHGVPFASSTEVYAGSYKDVEDADIVMITAGKNQRGNESRLSLINDNIKIFEEIIPNIMNNNFGGILLVVTNPVDILTHKAMEISGLPAGRVIGSGTVLDTARLKSILSKELHVDTANIHAYIIGEHGDSEIVVWSAANVYGMPLDKFCDVRNADCGNADNVRIRDEVRNSAREIILRKQATYYGIAMAVRAITEAIMLNKHRVLPVSVLMEGEHGISDIHMSMPAIVGRDGIEYKLPLRLSKEEEEGLVRSAATIKQAMS